MGGEADPTEQFCWAFTSYVCVGEKEPEGVCVCQGEGEQEGECVCTCG